MKKRLFIIIGSVIMLLGTILVLMAAWRLYDVALGAYNDPGSTEFVYHIGYLIGSTVIMFIGMGIFFVGYWFMRRGIRKKLGNLVRPDYESCRVIKAYQSAYPNPLKLKKDDRIKTGERESEWPGWIWCTDRNNVSGWVPEGYIRIEGNEAIMLYDYDATELTVNPGDQLLIINEEVGWYWCLDPKGNSGWVPKENVKINH